ncbi:MAG TPA: hypothetical protein VMT30_06100 [Candidatus Saccharimonadia bacterium]|nr:hypothetical protein [Candidatus Saccharimonadia bacterium]
MASVRVHFRINSPRTAATQLGWNHRYNSIEKRLYVFEPSASSPPRHRRPRAPLNWIPAAIVAAAIVLAVAGSVATAVFAYNQPPGPNGRPAYPTLGFRAPTSAPAVTPSDSLVPVSACTEAQLAQRVKFDLRYLLGPDGVYALFINHQVQGMDGRPLLDVGDAASAMERQVGDGQQVLTLHLAPHLRVLCVKARFTGPGAATFAKQVSDVVIDGSPTTDLIGTVPSKTNEVDVLLVGAG